MTVYLDYAVIERLASLSRSSAGDSGGLLLGSSTWDGAALTVVIDSVEPVAGEFWHGSARAPMHPVRRAFETALEEWRRRPDQPLSAVGYYRTGRAGGPALTSDDLFCIARYFSAPDSVFLAIERGNGHSPAAGFFFWELGRVRSEASYQVFPLDAVKLAPPPVPASALAVSSPEVGAMEAASGSAAGLVPASAPVARSGAPPWLWIALASLCVLLAVAVLGYVQLRTSMTDDQVVLARDNSGLLKVERAGSDFRVTWDRSSPSVSKGRAGTLAITDGAFSQEWQLDRDQLLGGSLLYTPMSSDVNFQLKVFPESGAEAVSASVRVLAAVAPRQPANGGGAVRLPARPSPAPPATRPADAAPETVFQPPPQVERQSAALVEPPPISGAGLRAASASPISRTPSLAPPPEPEPEPAAPPQPVPQAVTYTPPRAVRQSVPAMTGALRQALRLMREPEIEIEVRVDVDPNGAVTRVQSVNRGDGLRDVLSGIAEDAARQWRFEPARRNGQPVAGVVSVPFRFLKTPR